METPALYFNLSEMFVNGSVSSASYGSSKLIRTAIVAQKYKTLALTLSRNVTRSAINFTLSGKSHGIPVTVSGRGMHCHVT